MDIIAKALIDKKEYIIFLKNKKIHFAKKEKIGICFQLNHDEIDDLVNLYKKLLINQDTSRNVGETNVNGRTYNIFLDFSSGSFFFENKENKFLNIPEDNKILNLKYNNVPLAIHKLDELKLNNDNQEENEKIDDKIKEDEDDEKITFNKIVTLKHKIIIVTLSATLALNLLLPATSLSFINSVTEIASSISQNKEYNFEDIENAIKSNKNLTEEEKEFILKTKFIFDENYEYMDLDSIIEKLSTLKITYETEEAGESTSVGSTTGKYVLAKNEIVIYSAESFNDIITSSKKTDVFLHELFHVYQTYNGYSYIVELSNEAFTREAIYRMCEMGLLDKELFKVDLGYAYGSGYAISMEQFYYLAEMLTPEELKNLQFNNGAITSVSTIMKLDNSTDIKQKDSRAMELYMLFQETGDIDDSQKLLEQIGNIRESLNYYYKQQKGKEIGTDLETSVIYNLSSYIYNEYDQTKKVSPYGTLGEILVQETEDFADIFSESNPYRYCYQIECRYVPKAYFSLEYPASITYRLVIDERVTNRR